jgi:putative membrane protein
MSPVLHAALASWAIPWVPTLAICITVLVYLRGWYLLRCAGFPLIPPWRVWAFLSGMFSLWAALASPMDVFNGWLLTAHMLQHMVLMMLAPPLILLGAPVIPLVRGLPVFAAREFAGPFLNWRPAQRLGRLLTKPVFALVLMGVVMLGWHVPALYELAVRSPAWHQVEHACFFGTALIFWWPVIEPWPSHAQWPRWAMVPYLLIADLLNTILSAALVFADHVLYPSYLDAPQVFGMNPHQDQAAAGALMWVIGSMAFIIPAVWVGVQCLSRPSLGLQPLRLKKRRPILAGYWQRAMTKLGLDSWGADVTSFVALFIATGLAFSAVMAFAGPDDDDLALRARQQAGNLVLWVYAAGDGMSVGDNDVSVLVQDATGNASLDSRIEVSAARGNQDHNEGFAISGQESDPENKLMKTAVIELPTAGAWLIRVDAEQLSEPASVTFPVEAVIHQPGFDDWWPYLIFPVIAACLLLIYAYRHHAAASRLQPIAVAHSSRAAHHNTNPPSRIR